MPKTAKPRAKCADMNYTLHDNSFSMRARADSLK
jgi:hypothetical protein